jgi:hypothetical protein
MPKKDRKSRYINLHLYKTLNDDDTRYWGLFIVGKRIKIDSKRMFKILPDFLTEEMLNVINNRNTHYFIPKKIEYFDYNVNIFVDSINSLKDKWQKTYKPLINGVISKIVAKQFTPGDDFKMMSGISCVGAANARAQFKNMIEEQNAEYDKYEVIASMYSQFYHMMVSQIEATTVKVLHKNKLMGDTFNRSIMKKTCNGKSKAFEAIDGYRDYDKLYTIWHFIKHNSESTYKALKNNYPEVLRDVKYSQGQLALYYVKFDDALIEVALESIAYFFKKYCEIVFKENYAEAQWNYNRFFESRIRLEIENVTNPLGLDIFDDIE